VTTLGAGCGDLNTSATQCIKRTTTACALGFVSVAPDAGTGALDGGAVLRPDGTFAGASISFGTTRRTGCVGSWTEVTSTLQVTCGGVGSSQSCTATLTRTSMNW
jgi:hypothetical protein